MQTTIATAEPMEVIELDTEAEWLAARRQGIGASEAPAVLGVSPYQTPLQLYAEKLGLVEPDPRASEAIEWGLMLQPVIVGRYRYVTGRPTFDVPAYTLRRSREQPFMLASLDALTDLAPDVHRVPLEIKNVGGYKASEWEDEPPIWVQVQAQWQMAVVGAPAASIGALIGGNRFVWADLDRNERFIAAMIERCRDFWARLLSKEPPAVDGSEATRDLLRTLYPRDTPGLVVNLPGEAVEWDQQLAVAKEAKRTAEAVITEQENRLKAAIGEAEAGLLQTGVSFTWKSSDRKGYTVEATTTRTLRRRES